jgi:glycosyltransferase involved in cell wall biosynthesis
MTFVLAQLGARMHYAVPRILHAAGMLERLYTDTIAPPGALGDLLDRIGRNGPLRRVLARVPDGIPRTKIFHFPSIALQYYQRRRTARSPAELTAAYLWVGREFCRRVIEHGLGQAAGTYTFNSAGLELLQHARARGLLTVMEQTSAPPQIEDHLLAEEAQAFPGWDVRGHDPLRAEFAGRERAEWEAAHLILCGSEFVRQGIAACGGPAERCTVVPYGVDPPVSLPVRAAPHRPLQVLFVGAVAMHKGVPHIDQAARALKRQAVFRLVGSVSLLPDAVARLRQSVELLGPVPRPDVWKHYAWADVFLLPSICEGSATVCYEALAAGLPVITTPNAGSVVRDGVDGFIVPIRNPEAILQKLELLLSRPELLREMSRNALERATQFTVEKYGQRLLGALAGQKP